MYSKNIFLTLFAVYSLSVSLMSCSSKKDGLYELMDNKAIGIDFVNKVENSASFNIFNYRNFYNGGGVAVGDINNDGLPDMFFTSNMGSNKLFLNKGNWQFEDISEKAGIANQKKWSTGVVMVDLNNDKLLDIYVCNAGYQKGVGQENAMYINNGNLTFTDKAKEYGIADNGYTTHAAFFDYDIDGDLDVYILNNSFIPVNSLNYSNARNMRAEDWPVADFLKGGGDKLFRNDGTAQQPKFTDVSKEAGIYGSLIGFGLGVTVGDINGDMLPDIYVSNDFFEKDYLYVNKGDGTFKEDLENKMPHISLSSMGADMADINNDGYPEIFVTDMLPRDETRLKTTTTYESHYISELKQKKGLYNQFMQNTLQLNNQDGTFTDIAYYSDVASSDWSWGALMFDADNDAQTDIYVCNGIYQDVIDQDFIDFFADEITQRMVLSGKKEQFDNILKHIPSVPIANIFFHNKGNLKFEEENDFFGITDKSYSNGAAYADLDNDGDLDLVVNNANAQCFVYQNKAKEKLPNNHYLKVKLTGSSTNTYAIGSKVEVYAGGQIFSKYVMPSRGFQSSTEYPLTFGLGSSATIDSVRVIWPSRKMTLLTKVNVDKEITLDISSASKSYVPQQYQATKLYVTEIESPFDAHVENDYTDFFNEKNIPVLLSKEGPKFAVGDVNGDKQEDIFICGAKNQIGQLYLQKNGTFIKQPQPAISQHIQQEDTAAIFFDTDNDGDLDLYVGSGGNEGVQNDFLLQDRIYINDGKGNFSYNMSALPVNGVNTAAVVAIDYDKDNDLDLFVGGRSTPMQYGVIPQSYLFENQGNGQYIDVTAQKGKQLAAIGMVRDVAWKDLNGDKKNELVIVGDWMAPKVFSFDGKIFTEQTTGLEKITGFWGAVKVVDIDNDNDEDIILGNIGENFSLKANADGPLKLWVNDFDKNQLTDKVMSKSVGGKDVPIFLKREMTEQFPFLKTQVLKHSEYAKKTIGDLFASDVIENAQVRDVSYLKSVIAINDGKGNFKLKELPDRVQFSCVNAISTFDVNKDGKTDILLAGNSYTMLPQFGRLDGCTGLLLLNKGQGNFDVITSKQSGFRTNGQVKQMQPIVANNKNFLLSVANNEKPQLFSLEKP